MKSIIVLALILSTQAFAEMSVKRVARECVNTAVEERTWNGVVTTHYSRSTSVNTGEVTTDSTRPDWRQTTAKGENKYEVMRTDDSGNSEWVVRMDSTIERKTEVTTTELSENIYREIQVGETKSWSKPGFSYGENPDGSPITYRERRMEFDSTYFDDGRTTYAISDRIDGVDVPAVKAVYEYEVSKDGKVTTMVQRLVEPYSYPSDPEIKYISEETVCRTTKLD